MVDAPAVKVVKQN